MVEEVVVEELVEGETAPQHEHALAAVKRSGVKRSSGGFASSKKMMRQNIRRMSGRALIANPPGFSPLPKLLVFPMVEVRHNSNSLIISSPTKSSML